MKEYPYIGKSKYINTEVLFYSKDLGIAVNTSTPNCDSGDFVSEWDEWSFIEVDKSWFNGKYVDVESDDHHHFIKLLIGNHDLLHTRTDKGMGNLMLAFNGFSASYAKINLPLPPKEEIKMSEETNEEIKVGDTVTWGLRNDGNDGGEVKALDGEIAWVLSSVGHYHTAYIEELKKPKSEREKLRDELIAITNGSIESAAYAEAFAKYILDNYEIKPR